MSSHYSRHSQSATSHDDAPNISSPQKPGPSSSKSPSSDGHVSRKTSPDTLYDEQGFSVHNEGRMLQSMSKRREAANRVNDDLTVLKAEKGQDEKEEAKRKEKKKPSQDKDGQSTDDETVHENDDESKSMETEDPFDRATHTLREQAAVFRTLEQPTSRLTKFVKKVNNSSFLIRYFTYIVPVTVLILVPLLIGTFACPRAHVGHVRLVWFSVWLEVVWLTLWAGRVVARCLPYLVNIAASLSTTSSKKWSGMGKALEMPFTLFLWWIGVEISFLPSMKAHHVTNDRQTRPWERVVNKLIITTLVMFGLVFFEKIVIQLIAMAFHMRTYSDRIEISRFQIGSLAKLYEYSKKQIGMSDQAFERSSKTESDGVNGYEDKAADAAKTAFEKAGHVAGAVAGDFRGRQKSSKYRPRQVVLALLATDSGSQVLARRLYRTFVPEDRETILPEDLRVIFDSNDEAEASFSMFDKDLNGDITMEELEDVCAEIGRERKRIIASLKDVDSVVKKLDHILLFVVAVFTLLVFLSLISESTAGVLTSAGSSLLAISWLFTATAQEFFQSVVFVFVKHPFDVGDRVSIYGNTGARLTGDDYYVKEISLLFTEFKKMEGHVVQAPNSYLNTLFILNQRRSGGLAEAVPIIIRFGTTLDQIEQLRSRLMDFVQSEKRDFRSNVFTELREVTENWSITLNIVFFYKSNWQNELLRLQRRNKFICHLMVALQDAGIQGPVLNNPGATVESPWHSQPLPKYGEDEAQRSPRGPSSSPRSSKEQKESPLSDSRQPEFLRRSQGKPTMTQSLMPPHRQRDYSLGTANIRDDPFANVTDTNRTPSAYEHIVHGSNDRDACQRERERLDREAEKRKQAKEAKKRARKISKIAGVRESMRTSNV